MTYLIRSLAVLIVLVGPMSQLNAQWDHYLNKRVKKVTSNMDVSPNNTYMLLSHSNGIHLYDLKKQRQVLILENIVGFNKAIFTSNSDFVIRSTRGIDHITFKGNTFTRERFFANKDKSLFLSYDFESQKLYAKSGVNVWVFQKKANRKFVKTGSFKKEEVITHYNTKDQYMALVLGGDKIQLINSENFEPIWQTNVDSLIRVSVQYIDPEAGHIALLGQNRGKYVIQTLAIKDGQSIDRAEFKAKNFRGIQKLPDGKVLTLYGSYVTHRNQDLSHIKTHRIPEIERNYRDTEMIGEQLFIPVTKRGADRINGLVVYDLNTMKKVSDSAFPLERYVIKNLHSNVEGTLVIEKEPGTFVISGKEKIVSIPFIEKTSLTKNILLAKTLFRPSNDDSLLIHDIAKGQTEYIEQSQRFLRYLRHMDFVNGHVKLVEKDKIYDVSRSGDTTQVYTLTGQTPRTPKEHAAYVKNPNPQYGQKRLIASATFVLTNFVTKGNEYVDIHDIKGDSLKYQLKKTGFVDSNLENEVLIFSHETNRLEIFDPVSGKSNYLLRLGQRPRLALVTSDQRKLIYRYAGVFIKDIQTGEEIAISKSSNARFVLSPNEKYVLISNDDTIDIFDLANGRYRGVITTADSNPDYVIFFDEYYDGTEEAYLYLTKNKPEAVFERMKGLYRKMLVK